MAFSTQKEFFHVPFMNESVEFKCTEVCVKLKSYPSTNDDRSWAANEDTKSRFVSDLVACNTPISGPDGGKGRPRGPEQKSGQKVSGRPSQDSGAGSYGGSGQGSRSGSGPGDGQRGGFGRDEDPLVGDSLINAADDTIENMKKLMVQNNLLEKKLADSNDRLVTAKVQNDEIKRIMNERYDPDKSKRLKDKIQELSNSGKIDANDARELNDIQKSIDDMNKAHDIVEVENANLRRLIEKQSRRVAMDSIKIDPERSNDVNYLQNKIDSMGKELALLRQAEDSCIRAGGAADQSGRNAVEMDIESIQQMLAERDALRRKINALGMLENKVDKLQKCANKACNESGDLAKYVKAQNQYINDMECDMQEMQKYYENEIDSSKYNEEVLKCRCRDLQQQVISLQLAARRYERQQKEIDVMRNELRKRDVALSAYDCQYQQLMGVICELNKKYGNQHGDCPSFNVPECANIGDDLAFYTGATLEQIMRELCRQADCFKQMNQSQEAGDPKITNMQDCLQEMDRLRNLLKQKDSQLSVLVEENECMCEAALENNDRLNQLDEKVRELDRDTKYMEEGMRQSIGLIQDIGDVARKNEQLKDTVADMKQSDLQKLTDDLRKQLEDCMKKKQEADEMNKTLQNSLNQMAAETGKKFDIPPPKPEEPKAPEPVAKPPKTAEPAAKPPEPAAKPPEPAAKPPEPAAKPPESVAKPPESVAKSPESVAKSPESVAKSAEPVAKPPEPAAKPPEPAAKPPEPAAKPPEPAAKPPEPAAKPPEPAAKPPEPVAKPPEPVAKPPEPVAKPPEPVAKSPGPVSKPPEPVSKPPEPVSKPPEPVSKPPEPVAKPPGPVAKPPGPVAKSPGPAAKSPGPAAKSPEPAAKPPGPAAKPAGAGGSAPKLEKKPAPPPALAPVPKPVEAPKADGGAAAGGRPADAGDGGAGGPGKKPGPAKGAAGKGRGMKSSKIIDDTTEEQFDQFVKNTVKTLSAGEIDGAGLERELRKILDMFIDECGFCFCKCNIPKSRFYAICHKLYHHGLHTLDFKDLAYMHKRIFAAAENILPGCLFNIIMKDFIAINPQTLNTINTASHRPKSENQCCTCKSALCCDDTEEKLIVKVMRLENDIENAKQCLKNLKSIPSDISIHDCRMEAGDCVSSERVVRSPRETKSIAVYKQIKQTRRIKKAFAANN